jgi:c-di-AMP phosphodiesterase-like protein
MGLFFWDEILAYMVNLQLNQLLKPVNKIINCVIFMLFFTNSQAQQVVDNLNQAERLIVQDIRAADQTLRDLELVIVNASNTDKLRWLTLSLNTSATLEHTPRLQQLKNMYPKLLKTFGNEGELWRHLFSLTLEVFIENSTSALTQLQAIEAKVESFNAPFMSAFFIAACITALLITIFSMLP